MEYPRFCQELALERCRLCVAQLCAIHYFVDCGSEIDPAHCEMMEDLLKALSRDLDALEHSLFSSL